MLIETTEPSKLEPPLLLPAEVEAMFWSRDELIGVIIACSEVTGSPSRYDPLTVFVARELRAAGFVELRRRNPGLPGAPAALPVSPVRPAQKNPTTNSQLGTQRGQLHETK